MVTSRPSPFPFQFRLRANTKRIILHSSHTTPDVARVEDYLRVTGRTMGLLEVGYHCVIERNGEVANCRPLMAVGSHTPGHNADSVGICFAGGMEVCPVLGPSGAIPEEIQTDNFLPEQIRAGLRLVDHLLETFGPCEVVGHTELQKYHRRNLQCPGFDMDLFRKRLSQPYKEYHRHEHLAPAS